MFYRWLAGSPALATDSARRYITVDGTTFSEGHTTNRGNNTALMMNAATPGGFKADKFICATPSGEAVKQIMEIQDFVTQLIPDVKGRVRPDKLHLTLLALSGGASSKNVLTDLLEETASLDPKIKAHQLKIYGGHLVLTIECSRALHISERLMEVARDEGIRYDPIQGLHITLFRGVGSEVANFVEKELADFGAGRELSGLSDIELFDMVKKTVTWKVNIPEDIKNNVRRKQALWGCQRDYAGFGYQQC